MKTLEQIKSDLESQTKSSVTIEGTAITLQKENLLQVAQFLKSNSDYQMDYLANLTATDFKDYIEVVYHIYSIAKREGPITLKTKTDRAKALVPSVTPVWRGAEFQEREVYDLLGVHFEHHPDLRRILMWEGFEHYPLRKDYVIEDQDRETAAF